MDWWQAVVLGLVEGITEYLPISSTGHLILAERALGIQDDEAARAFAICIQSGAIVAVLGLYRTRVRALLAGVIGRDAAGSRLARRLMLAFLPAAVIGKLFGGLIEHNLFGLWPVIWAWFAGGVAILLLPVLRAGRPPEPPEPPEPTEPTKKGRALEDLRLRAAFLIGLAQCLAFWPGTSRSLATIAAGLLLGLTAAAAVEFSLLLGALTLLVATAYKAFESGAAMHMSFGPLALVLGFGVAWISAAAAVQWLVGYLQSHGLALFGWYRVVLALAVAALVHEGLVAAS